MAEDGKRKSGEMEAPGMPAGSAKKLKVCGHVWRIEGRFEVALTFT